MEMLSLVINTDSIILLSICVTTFLFMYKYQTMFVTHCIVTVCISLKIDYLTISSEKLNV